MSNDAKPAGPSALIVPLLAFLLGVALAFVPTSFTYGMAALLVYGPLPILAYRHRRGRKGGWGVAGMIVASFPYFALIVWLLTGGQSHHIPL